MSSVLLWLAVGVLGGLAAIARFLLAVLVTENLSTRFPLGTFLVNLSGAMALGLLVGFGLHGHAYLLVGTAVIGSYTTFSTWMLECHRLATDSLRWMLVAYVGSSLVLGVAAAALGRAIGGG